MESKLEDYIKEFVKSGSKEYKLPYMVPVREMEDLLKKLGFDELELGGDETNGWQIDFWYKFHSDTYGDYMLSGSLHYGDFKLTKED